MAIIYPCLGRRMVWLQKSFGDRWRAHNSQFRNLMVLPLSFRNPGVDGLAWRTKDCHRRTVLKLLTEFPLIGTRSHLGRTGTIASNYFGARNRKLTWTEHTASDSCGPANPPDVIDTLFEMWVIACFWRQGASSTLTLARPWPGFIATAIADRPALWRPEDRRGAAQ